MCKATKSKGVGTALVQGEGTLAIPLQRKSADLALKKEGFFLKGLKAPSG